MSHVRKRSRNVLSIERKLQIIDRLEKGTAGSTLARIFNVGQATISDIKSKKDLILKFASNLDSEDGSKRRKTMKNSKDKKLDEAIFLWFVQRRSRAEPISGPLLCEKALELNIKLDGPPDFKASTGWLKNFKSRHGIREFEVQGESLSAENFKISFLNRLVKEGYALDDVYNADEFGLYWKALPCKALASGRETKDAVFKVNKERITVMVTANATGSHLLPPLMIGKAKKPQCLKNVACLPVYYRAQKSSWMDCDIFFDWYTNEFIPNVMQFREKETKTGKVLLLLDNAPSHPEVEKLNAVHENFGVIFLPPNVSTLLQPMYQGIIEKLKRAYKKQILRHLMLAEDEESVMAFSKRLNLKDCCYMVVDAWHTISQDDVKNAWKRLLGDKREIEEAEVGLKKDIKQLVDMFQKIPGFSDCDANDAQEWLDVDDDPGFQILNDDEIVSYVREEQEAVADDEDREEIKKNGPSHEEACTALETAMLWYKRQEESSPAQLLLLKRVHNLAAKKRSSNLVK